MYVLVIVILILIFFFLLIKFTISFQKINNGDPQS